MKKPFWRQINRVNLVMGGISVAVSFMIVSLCDAVSSPSRLSLNNDEIILRSVQRLADAFDLYNQKRFAGE